MADTHNSELAPLFDKLTAAVDNQEHKKALKFAEQILKVAPKDEDALRSKIVALMQLGQFEDALPHITSSKLAEPLVWEKAYCLYRLTRVSEALAAVQKLPAADPRRLELEAQLHYKLGNSKLCINTYDQLFQLNKAPALDLKANVLAAYVAAGLAGEVVALMGSMKITAKQSFEIAFNKACGLLESGHYAQADAELRQAFKLARETLLMEEQPEEVVAEETAPLLVQLGYVAGRLGQYSAAMKQYSEVLEGGHADTTTTAVATVNSIADGMRAHGAGHHRKFFASALKKLDALTDKQAPDGMRLLPVLEQNLSAKQKEALHLNRALLAVMAGRLEVAAAIAQHLRSTSPSSGPVALLAATVLAKQGKAQDADALLAAYAADRKPDTQHAQAALLMRAQLALEGGQPAAALPHLAALGSGPLATSPALLATRCSLHEQVGDIAGAEALLEGGLAALKAAGATGGQAAARCLQGLVELKLRLGKPAEAAAAYQQLRDLGVDSSSSALVLSKLARATAALDPALTQSYAADLPPPPRLAAEQLDSLEGSSIRSAVVAPRVSKKRDADPEAGGEPKAKKRKKRKPKYPKGFDPEKPGPLPDPERWLPKWERADYKKKAKRRQKDGVKGSQGAGKVDDNLDSSRPMEVDTPAPKQQPSGGKGKGKKGRR